jgi:hypothetical protein
MDEGEGEMKTTLTAASVLTIVLASAGLASAQSATSGVAYGALDGDYGAYGYGYHASTLEEGLLRGHAALAEGLRRASYYNSLAAINAQEAYARYIQNRQKATETYFTMRQTNRAAREAAAPQPLSHAQYVALAKKLAPAELSEGQYDRTFGRLAWPAALLSDEFAAEREALDRAFRGRSPGEAGASPAFTREVKQVAAAMQGKLKNNIDEMGAGQYATAKNFLASLSYEAEQPLVVRSLAVAR